MNLIDEMSYDMDFREPKIIVNEKLAIIENVEAIVMISENSLTVATGKRYVTVQGGNFTIKEIFKGRLLIEGTIQGVEFLRAQSGDKDRRVQNR